jgi:hypothetical protein
MKFEYQDLIENGFKRTNCEDSVWFLQYGFQYFILSKTLNEYAYFDWDIHTQRLAIIKHDKEHTIIFKRYVESLEEYKLIETLLEKPNK